MVGTNIDTLTLEVLLKDNDFAKKLNNMTKAIKSFNSASGDFSKVQKVFDKINKVSPTSTRGGSTSNGGTKNKKSNLDIFGTLGKWNYLINMTRYYGRSLRNIVQLSMDYVETQNLWQVANRNNLEMADEFIAKMNKAYGVSEQTLMNYQAIFKNMLSALGGISDEISSGLSMQLTQMALDFSSLYNVTIPSAMQKFQAVLSGQVRPIRSVSGYDITENTIFDLYAGAGGEKTMRQLSQIEKRLLRIVAVFDQMNTTGAKGDMAKTIESASNQARIMSEQFKETLTWTGQLILMWMDSSGLLQNINAFLIATKEIIRGIAYDMGYREENFLDGLVVSAEEVGEAVDNIQGKLLSFDKFEALNSNDSNILGIDQTVLDLLEKVNYQTEEFQMQANKTAREWLNNLGFIDENGDGIVDITQKARDFLDVVKSIGIALGVILGASAIKSIVTFGINFTKWIVTPVALASSSIVYLATGVLLFIDSWKDMTPLTRALTIITSLVAALVAGAVAWHAFKGNWAKAVAVGALVGGAAMSVGSIVGKVPQYATGGFPEDGLFFANSGEMVGKFTNGKTAVANNDQIVTGITQGVYNAMMTYNAQTRGQSGGGDVYLDGTKVGRVVAKSSHNEMKRIGLIKTNV